MRKILMIGAGKSASYLVKYFLERSISEKLEITIGDLDLTNAKKWTKNNPNAYTLKLDIFDEKSRKKAIINADIVVSMLPARFHIEVAKDCLYFGKHMVTASYISKEMQALNEQVKSKKLVFFNEILSPLPFQPVLTRNTLEFADFIFFDKTLEYFVGCNIKNAAP